MRDVFDEIAKVFHEGGDWCTLDRANALAALTLALQPKVVVEVGVWLGGSLVPIMLAMKHTGIGTAIAIDPWAASASVIDQDAVNAEWWGKVDHNAAMQKFVGRLEKHGLSKICQIWRRRSDDCDPPPAIDLLSIDGNHGAAAVRDVERFGSRVNVGGILALDDLNWGTGHVALAYQAAVDLGFVERYMLGTGMVMQRVRAS